MIDEFGIVQPMEEHPSGLPDMRTTKFPGAIVVQNDNREGSIVFSKLVNGSKTRYMEEESGLVTVMWKFIATCGARLSCVIMGFPSQVLILDGYTSRPFLSEVYAVIFTVVLTCEVTVYTVVSEQPKWFVSS